MDKIHSSEQFHRLLACSLIRAAGGEEEIPIKYLAKVKDLGTPHAVITGKDEQYIYVSLEYRNGE
jgi:hypothetical protein